MPDHMQTLEALGISRRRLADRLGVSEGYVRQQLTGARPMQPALDKWMRDLARWLERHPVPRREAS